MRKVIVLFIVFAFLSCKKESNLKVENNIIKDTAKKLAITSPINGSIINKDDTPVIEIKWNPQKNAISYEIQADYSSDFTKIGKNSLAHNLIISASDSVASIQKLKINWNCTMYLRIRAIYADSTSNWSDVVSINISDPRLNDYLGNYLIDIYYTTFNAGVYDTVMREDVFCTISKVQNSSNLFECGLMIKDTIRFSARYNPYYTGIGNYYEYNKSKFYTENQGLPLGSINFIVNNSGEIILDGTYKVDYKTGSVNYTLKGKKI